MIKDTNKRVVITLTQKEYDALCFCADDLGFSKSSIVKMALASVLSPYLQQNTGHGEKKNSS